MRAFPFTAVHHGAHNAGVLQRATKVFDKFDAPGFCSQLVAVLGRLRSSHFSNKQQQPAEPNRRAVWHRPKRCRAGWCRK